MGDWQQTTDGDDQVFTNDPQHDLAQCTEKGEAISVPTGTHNYVLQGTLHYHDGDITLPTRKIGVYTPWFDDINLIWTNPKQGPSQLRIRTSRISLEEVSAMSWRRSAWYSMNHRESSWYYLYAHESAKWKELLWNKSGRKPKHDEAMLHSLSHLDFSRFAITKLFQPGREPSVGPCRSNQSCKILQVVWQLRQWNSQDLTKLHDFSFLFDLFAFKTATYPCLSIDCSTSEGGLIETGSSPREVPQRNEKT